MRNGGPGVREPKGAIVRHLIGFRFMIMGQPKKDYITRMPWIACLIGSKGKNGLGTVKSGKNLKIWDDFEENS